MMRLVWLMVIAAGCQGRQSAARTVGTDGTPDSVADGGSTGDAGSQPADDLPCAVGRIFSQHCIQCHGATPKFGAPMSLGSYADLIAPAPSDPKQPVYAVVKERIHGERSPMPPKPNPSLSAAELTVLDDWISAGAPTMSCKDAEPTEEPVVTTALPCAPDRHIAPSMPYALPPDGDDAYVCYGFDVAVARKRHAVAFAPRIDNASALHHASLFQADTAVSGVPAPCPPLGAQANWRPIWGWAPGVRSFEMPQAAGFPEEDTVHYVVQLHYHYSMAQVGSFDASGFDVCTTDQLRANDADVMTFGTQRFTLPPKMTTDITCSVDVPWYGNTTHLLATLPHMHKLGQQIATVAWPIAGGGPIDLGAVSNWDFAHQNWLSIDFILKPNDRVDTRCVWKNDTKNEVTFGPSTDDEMCYAFIMYYPRITNALWNPLAPAYWSLCAPTP